MGPNRIKNLALRQAILYAIIAGFWIICSDWLLSFFTTEAARLTAWQTYKGWFFVIVTAAILYFLLEHALRKLQLEIDGRNEAEQALRDSESRLVRAQHIAKMGDFTWDQETNIITWSKGMYDLLLYDIYEPITVGTFTSKIQHPDDLQRVITWIETSLARYDTELPPNEYRIIRKDGKVLTVRAHGAIEWKEGRKPRIFATVVDISDFIQAEQEREKMHMQFIQGQKMESIGRLAGGIAHDFNNMLSVIIGYTDLALETIDKNDPVHEYLSEVRFAATRSASITSQLLAFSRKQVTAPQLVDLNKSVEGTLKMLHRLINEEIDLIWRPGNGTYRAKIDPTQIDQLLANLCINGRDAISGVGKIVIETDMTHIDEQYCAEYKDYLPGDYVTLTVSDTGSGMNQETRKHLFEPFFTTKPDGKGTGLGLATVFGIVKQNNGFIIVSSEPGQGSTFTIYLPRAQEPEFSPLAAETPRDVTRGNETILVVEDDQAILKLIEQILGQLGYTILTATTPVNAVAVATRHDDAIDLLITDVVMPGMNGRELGEHLQNDRPSLRILFMSGYTASTISHHGVFDHRVNFISKPFTRQVLAAKVRTTLDNPQQIRKRRKSDKTLNSETSQ